MSETMTAGLGPATDRYGNAVLDPTVNVKEQLAAAVKRQDDLRDLEANHVRELNALRTEYEREINAMRISFDDRLRFSESARTDAVSAHNRDTYEITANHIEAMNNLRASYEEKLREAETGRINAIRAVDAQQVSRAAEVAAAQATTLAGQVAASAEALRAQVEQTRIQFSTTLSAALEPVQKDIADLRRVQYEQAGKVAGSTEVNPRDTAILAAIQQLQQQANIDRGQREAHTDTRNVGQSNRTFIAAIIGVSIAFFGLVITAGGVAVALIVG